jgi:acetylornithine deacetylase/succinyl-diaminopimelate desuccinylase-like protein
VPNQSSEKISILVEEYLAALAPPAVEVKITRHHGGEPYVASLGTPAYLAASKALQKTYSKEPVPIHSGGTIPIIPLFEEVLETKSILMGFGLDSDAIHAPNEHYSLTSFYRGIETIPYFYRYFAEMAG